jgi:hypothetical protein
MDRGLVRLGLTWDDVADDVYLRRDFVTLYAMPDGIDALELPDYRHLAALRPIPGTDLCDLETPYAYGGPVAPDADAFGAGIETWRTKHAAAGHVCEFLRLYPFIAVERMAERFDEFRFDRDTVVVDLGVSAEDRLKWYSQSTRRFLRKAQRAFRIRRLDPDEHAIFQHCYEAGLRRSQARPRYYFTAEQHRLCLAAPWATAFVLEAAGEAVGAALFLHSRSLAHYHLAGLTDAGIAEHGLYLLLDHAFNHFAASGQRWMHLGGGRSTAPDDTLLHFKRRFSETMIPFHTAGLIYDREAFARLGGGRDGRLQAYRA